MSRCSVPHLLERIFSWHGGVLVRHYRLYLGGSALVWLLLTFGWLFFRIDNDMMVTFSPVSSDLADDRRSFERFFGFDSAITMYMMVLPTNTSHNLLDYGPQAANIIEHIETNISVPSHTHPGKHLTYKSLEYRGSPFLEVNKVVKIILREKELHDKLTYATSKALTHHLYLPFAMGGISYDNHTKAVTAVSSVLLRYVIWTPNAQMKEEGLRYLNHLQDVLKGMPEQQPLRFTVHSIHTLQNEVRKNTVYTLHWVPGSLVLVLVFTIVVCSTLRACDCCCVHAVAGLVSVVLSYTAAMGFCFYLGLYYNDLVSLTSFLALAIGVDDTFILLSAWRLNAPLTGKCVDTGCADYEQRMRVTMKESGTSILFTSLTDVLAFGVGTTMTVPALRDFCFFTATAIAFDFAFQITFFPAMMIVCEQQRPRMQQFEHWVKNKSAVAQWYKKKRPALRTVTQVNLMRAVDSSADMTLQYGAMPADTQPTQLNDYQLREADRCQQPPDTQYCLADAIYRLVSTPGSQMLIIALFFVYVIASTWMASTSQINMSFKKLLTDDSFIFDYVDLFDKYHWSQAYTLHCVATVHNYDDASANGSLHNFLRFADELESLPQSLGQDDDFLWIRQYLNFKHMYRLNALDYLNSTNTDLGPHTYVVDMSNFVRVNASAQSIRFHMQFAFAGSRDWDDRVALLLTLASIRAKPEYEQHDIAMYSSMSFMTDMMLYTKNSSRVTLGLVLISTFGVILLFLTTANALVMFVTSLSFLCINVGVFGGLVLWHTDADFVSMVTVLMSVGFSVDYTVHVSYMFSRQLATGQTSKQAVRSTLVHVARPIVQSGCSTLIAVCLISFVHSYMVRTFLKTVLLVVLLGLLQSLFILPVLFLLIQPTPSLRKSQHQPEESSTCS